MRLQTTRGDFRRLTTRRETRCENRSKKSLQWCHGCTPWPRGGASLQRGTAEQPPRRVTANPSGVPSKNRGKVPKRAPHRLRGHVKEPRCSVAEPSRSDWPAGGGQAGV